MNEQTVQLILDSLWPLLQATVTGTIPLTAISFVLGLALALVVAAHAALAGEGGVRGGADVHLGHPRHAAAAAAVHHLLRPAVARGQLRPLPGGVLAFTLNVGGYAAEVIRSAILAVPKGQWEAASTVGMNYPTTLRRVVLPQATRTAIPPLSNTLISLVKDTSLASTIQVTELFRTAQEVAAPTYQFFAMYAVAAAYYWVICLALSFGQSRLEERQNRYVAR